MDKVNIVIPENGSSDLVDIFLDWDKLLDNCKERYPVGIGTIDKATGGGFEEGIHFLAASPSIGKTTLMAQFAYNFAKSNPVLFFSLEQGKLDILGKHVAMETYLTDTVNTNYAVSASKLRTKAYVENASEVEKKYVTAASERVKERTKNETILDSSDRYCCADSIVSYVEKFIEEKKQKPVVLIDYLQFLAPPNHLLTAQEKAQLDHSVGKLAELAHTKKLLVFCISSITKATLTDENSDMSAFSGTGRIIFDADGLYTMWYQDTDNLDESRAKTIREIKFKILKQRNGKAGEILNLNMHTVFSYFFDAAPVSQKELEEECPFEQQTLDFKV